MQPNFSILALAALVPLVMGFIWYNPKVFGAAWMKAAGMTEENMKGGNMALIFGLTYLFSFMLSMALNFIVIHQFHVFSALLNEPGLNEPGSAANNVLNMFKDNGQYAHNFRTFKHGVFHGIVASITFTLPILAVNAMFERKSVKYVAINVGFWAICSAIMGGIICACS